MKKRMWFRQQVKKELSQYKGNKKAVKRRGLKPTLTNRVLFAMKMLN